MSTGRRHLAFDFGAESGRAIAGRIEDGRLVMEELHRFPTRSVYVYDSLRWNIYRFYEEILTGMRRYAERFGPELDSIGIDTWGVDYGLLNRAGAVMELPYQYRDDRTRGTDAIIDEKLGKRRVYDITGIQFMTINTLNQLVAARRDTPDELDSACEMLFIGDILHYLLSGKRVSEFTTASTSQMLDAHSKTWSEEILNAFHIPQKICPKIVFAGDEIGTLSDKLAQASGLHPGVRIIAPAVHDTASAAAAIPASGHDWAYISTGTWCMVGLETSEPVITDDSFAMNISNSGGVLGTNLFLKNVMGLWIIQQCKKVWDNLGLGLDYPAIVERALSAPAFAAFIDPDDDLFFSPENNIEAIRAYLTKTDQKMVDLDDVGVVARIVYECLALKYRYVVEKLQAAAQKTVKSLHLIGGGTRNALLNEFTCSAIGVPVLAGPGEATAMGNLLLQAYGCGEVASLEELRAIVRASQEIQVYEPNTAARTTWDEAYINFCRICRL